MEKPPVIVVGAGAAGLSAAHELAEAEVDVRVLEARQRLGGRIYTSRTSAGIPVELGAEFVHGKSPEIWDIIKCAKLAAQVVTDRHRLWHNSQLTELPDFWDGLEKIMEQIDSRQKDQSFAEFLATTPGISSKWKDLAKDFVEGFDAARTERISIQALAKDQEASERIEGDQSFRIPTGYVQIIEFLASQLKSKNVPVHCGMKVETIQWQNGAVLVSATGPEGPTSFTAARAIITLPLGVLKSGQVKFEPEVKEKKEAIEGLEMGKVVKVNLQFRSRLWSETDFGFVHAHDEELVTWWAHPTLNLLTGWAGGPKAEQLAGEYQELIVGRATTTLAQILKVKESTVKQELEAVHFHDWTADPFARGAYTYIPVGLLAAQQHFAQPVQDTLFFAGEATALDAQLGTVHSALGSGKHAAREVLRSLARSE